ncbi:hypothetical protein IVB69_02145 [Flavobacterium sp. J49]|uniref:hypothetical protein n=1 Tax=Flavobacterium sp. J49 TaxID=2718534 RepID=UPI001592B099|nr:hypothetical protein [Flavobacterium sp. J49]MBF6640273.1 hypothetical protein [Flavobacterium sp. J49]NIC01518.1 hypothetical protein [Flavobacterium sp. J49]
MPNKNQQSAADIKQLQIYFYKFVSKTIKTKSDMARVIAPFKITGTIDELNFYIDQNKVNRVREKGKTGVSSEEFKRNPIFEKVKKHSKEFGRAVKYAQGFRATAYHFFNRAKDGSFAGRANKLMFEIIEEDATNQHGERTLENGLLSPDTNKYFEGFEGNKLRPLNNVLKAAWSWEETTSLLTINNFNPKTSIDWPENAQQVHLAIARSNWNYTESKFTTHFSEEIILQKEEATTNLQLQTSIPPSNHLQLLYLFIGFSTQERKKTKELKRSNNTVTIIWSK